MELQQKIKIFSSLGDFLRQFAEGDPASARPLNDDDFAAGFESLIQTSQSYNGWFTPEQIRHSAASWADALTPENLNQWLKPYEISPRHQKTVGLILAGNIPLVGFHDFISVIFSGHKALIRLSSNDQLLLPYLAKYLIYLEPELAGQIEFSREKLENFDAVIATGSNNTSRYFEYYFRNKPAIIRKNRNSVAVLTGDESQEQLTRLGDDIFRYFGLGCRNVSKIFVPQGYDFTRFFEAMYRFRSIVDYKKYANNYDYNKAVFLMSNFRILDNGFLTLKEDSGYSSPISSVFYEYYDDIEKVKSRLAADAGHLQCVVSGALPSAIPFGQTQQPRLWDYADNVDTIKFLTSL